MAELDSEGTRYSASQRTGCRAVKRRVKLIRLEVGKPIAAAITGPKVSLDSGMGCDTG